MKLIAFNRGKAISAAPIMMGTNRFEKPPISAGITQTTGMKKRIGEEQEVRTDRSSSGFPGPSPSSTNSKGMDHHGRGHRGCRFNPSPQGRTRELVGKDVVSGGWCQS